MARFDPCHRRQDQARGAQGPQSRPEFSVPGAALREAPGEDAGRRRRARPLQRLDHSRQPEPVQLLHDRDGQGRDPRLPRRERGARRRRRGLHRRRRQGLLHRRQHQGIRRILRRQPAGIPAVHAPLQRHGLRDPRLRQAGDLPRQRHAHRRRPGDRHGLRLLGRAGPRALRPGRAQARFRRDRRRHRLPAAHGRHGARDGIRHALRALVGAQGLPPGPALRHRPRRSRSTASSSPIRWS